MDKHHIIDDIVEAINDVVAIVDLVDLDHRLDRNDITSALQIRGKEMVEAQVTAIPADAENKNRLTTFLDVIETCLLSAGRGRA